MNKRWLVVKDEDFGSPLTLSRVDDLLECRGDADWEAEEAIRNGSKLAYVFCLESVYTPADGGRMVEVRQVSLERSVQATLDSGASYNYGGTGD